MDVKDENGEVGFLMPNTALARKVGATKPYYKAGQVAGKARAAGVYLIGRIVTFEDPILSQQRPDLAIRRADGSVWTNSAGLGWTNPYDKRVWDYNIEIAKAAAAHGFDEIQFDYVRFPSDGDVENTVYRGKVNEDMGWTIARFVQYAAKQPHSASVCRSTCSASLPPITWASARSEEGRAVRRRDLPHGLPLALQPGRVQPAGSERRPGQPSLRLCATTDDTCAARKRS